MSDWSNRQLDLLQNGMFAGWDRASTIPLRLRYRHVVAAVAGVLKRTPAAVDAAFRQIAYPMTRTFQNYRPGPIRTPRDRTPWIPQLDGRQFANWRRASICGVAYRYWTDNDYVPNREHICGLLQRPWDELAERFVVDPLDYKPSPGASDSPYWAEFDSGSPERRAAIVAEINARIAEIAGIDVASVVAARAERSRNTGFGFRCSS